MENLKSALLLIALLIIIVLVGYWAFFTLDSGSLHAEKQKQEELKNENEKLKEEIENLKSEIRTLTRTEEIIEPEEENTETPSTNTIYKNQTLITELEKLIADKVVMKEKSSGTRVGTVQKFLNIYNNTSKKIDNDFGPGMKADILNFQKKEGLIADGEAGPSTFQKMVDWLKKQG
ncbi:MAG: peptidoglycan-binding domain-containing protein [Candidatus Paceibacterota bacterium]|jgi:murein L,D-transpeptidase YcbB/YkuD